MNFKNFLLSQYILHRCNSKFITIYYFVARKQTEIIILRSSNEKLYLLKRFSDEIISLCHNGNKRNSVHSHSKPFQLLSADLGGFRFYFSHHNPIDKVTYSTDWEIVETYFGIFKIKLLTSTLLRPKGPYRVSQILNKIMCV